MKLAIIFPYKDRPYHKMVMIPYLGDFLNRTQPEIDFSLHVIKSDVDMPFNRGISFNIGYDLVKNDCEYVCFHDIDMLPVICDYSIELRGPCHLATGCSQYKYKLPHKKYFGGINIFTKETFEKLDGFSNEYWLWGTEDNDMYRRCKKNNLNVIRRTSIHECFEHPRDKSYDKMNRDLYEISINRKSGLSTLDYQVKQKEKYKLYTEYTVRYDILSYRQQRHTGF